jgi:hypothetical protein
MGIDRRNKLNQLLSNWATGQVRSTKWLKHHGYGSSFVQKYKKGLWIEALGAGAYKKYGDSVNWASGIACIQKELNLPVHIGGKSALELLGKSQYIMLNQKSIIVLGNKKELLPAWLKNYDWDVTLDYKVKNLFKNDSFGKKKKGYTTLEFENSDIILSAPERAFLEYLDELPKMYSYTEATEILENLTSLRSATVQLLLENCNSIKVKRLFLHLAEKVKHPWIEKIDTKKIELGKGKRLIFSDGILEPKYQITIPSDTAYEEI